MRAKGTRKKIQLKGYMAELLRFWEEDEWSVGKSPSGSLMRFQLGQKFATQGLANIICS
jgi:hypothetical protein